MKKDQPSSGLVFQGMLKETKFFFYLMQTRKRTKADKINRGITTSIINYSRWH